MVEPEVQSLRNMYYYSIDDKEVSIYGHRCNMCILWRTRKKQDCMVANICHYFYLTSNCLGNKVAARWAIDWTKYKKSTNKVLQKF